MCILYTEYTMTGSSVAYILNKHFCAVVGSAAIDSRLQTPIPDGTLILQQRNGWTSQSQRPLQYQAAQLSVWFIWWRKKNQIPTKCPKFPNCLQMHRCVAIVPTLPFLHAAPNDLKALEINKAPIPGGRSKMSLSWVDAANHKRAWFWYGVGDASVFLCVCVLMDIVHEENC